ncbi:MAG: dephospho-CoA kinase [Stomatobaculum sp.]|nr:dephospho-CoA kinase [Stomatobaculum sp.]
MKLCIFGGVGSGKSVALGYLKNKYGAEIIGMDETAHLLYEPGRKGFLAVKELLGPSVVREDGTLDRGKMADLLYADKEKLAKLNSMIHPLVYAEVDRRMESSKAELTVVETALPSAGRKSKYDEIWYVFTPAEIRRARLMQDRGYSSERVDEIMAKQPADDTYTALADWVLENSGTPEDLMRRIDERLERKVKKVL